MDINTNSTKNASVTRIPGGFKLIIDSSQTLVYRCAQLDDYAKLKRSNLPHHSLTLSLRARASNGGIPGTWGFGLWNDPFGLSLGFGGNPFRLPALPNAVWFFSASSQNYLSFKDDKPAQGFLTQVFRAPRLHRLMLPAAIALPFSRKKTRNLLGRVIEEDSVAINLDVTEWHAYRLAWNPKQVLFEVDNTTILDSGVSPRGPLGVIIWIDNQYAAFTPEGKIKFGVLENPELVYVEICDLKLTS